MTKVYIELDATKFSGKPVSEKYRKDAAQAMFAAARNALEKKCQVDLNPKQKPKAGLSLGGTVESIKMELVGTQTKVSVKVSMQLSLWPAPSVKSKDGTDMFGLMSGNSTVIDGSSDRQQRDSVLFAVADASKSIIQNRIDTGILAWQTKTNTQLDRCEESRPPNKP